MIGSGARERSSERRTRLMRPFRTRGQAEVRSKSRSALSKPLPAVSAMGRAVAEHDAHGDRVRPPSAAAFVCRKRYSFCHSVEWMAFRARVTRHPATLGRPRDGRVGRGVCACV